MKKNYSLINYMKTYYSDSNIPMYLFSNDKCSFCVPEQDELTYPPSQYLQELFASKERISHCTTEYGIIFCSLKLDSMPNKHLVFGPVTTVPYSDSDLQHLCKDYMIPNNRRSDFNAFLRQIPCLSMSSLLKNVSFSIIVCMKKSFHSSSSHLPVTLSQKMILLQMLLFS